MKIKRLYLYLCSFFLAFHWYSIMYINSSYLNEFVSEKTLSLLYTFGSFLTLVVLFMLPGIIRKYGLRNIVLCFITLETIAIMGMALSQNSATVSSFFVLHSLLMPMILFCLDVFLEHYTDMENMTGEVRSTFLTASNVSLVIAPGVMGIVIGLSGISSVYIYSLVFLIPLFYIIASRMENIHDGDIDGSTKNSLYKIFQNKDTRNILISHQVLQLYYAFMIIYTPIYLHQYIGIDWPTIGVLFSIMLLPFVIFEIPAGKIADKKFGEKEILIIGYVIMGLATLAIYKMAGTNFAIWAVILFMTRVGASLIEVTSESYFFKHVKGQDSGIISIFRATRPVSFIIAPILAAGILIYSDFSSIFLILSIITFMGIIPSLMIKDTK